MDNIIRKTRTPLTILLFTMMLVWLIPAVFAQRHDPKVSDQKFSAALQIVRMAYVDTVNEAKLTEDAIIAMLKKLDPHSTYISKADVEKANEPLVGNFEGIGIQFNMVRDTIVVITPVPDGPSEKLGILSGDKIVKIDGENCTGSKVNEEYVLKHLRGAKGTQVTLTIFRKGRKDLMEYVVTRDKIPINSMDASYIAAPGIGYIKLNKFGSTTMNEFTKAMGELKEKGMESLILDLRDNSGGYLNTAISLADEFLAEGKLIVYTEGFYSPKQESFASAKGDFETGKLVVLINEGSASASEIVAGAVQDWDRALIIGRRSFGKGLVQRPYNLPDGSVMRLTTAHYFTPTGRCVQKPYNEGTEKYFKDLTDRYKHGELVNPDSIKFPDSLKYYTPNKRVVYGGGGVMPDLFIPLDTTRITDYYSDLLRKNLINLYVLQYLDVHRAELKKEYADVEEYAKKYVVEESFMKDFLAFAEKEGVKKNEEQYKISEVYLKNFIKAWIARNLWNYGAFWRVFNENDEAFKDAVGAIQDKNKFKDYKLNY